MSRSSARKNDVQVPSVTYVVSTESAGRPVMVVSGHADFVSRVDVRRDLRHAGPDQARRSAEILDAEVQMRRAMISRRDGGRFEHEYPDGRRLLHDEAERVDEAWRRFVEARGLDVAGPSAAPGNRECPGYPAEPEPYCEIEMSFPER